MNRIPKAKIQAPHRTQTPKAEFHTKLTGEDGLLDPVCISPLQSNEAILNALLEAWLLAPV
jgi:hypothetical protein